MRVINESRIDFKYQGSIQSPIITKTIFSNIVTTTIVKNTLVVKKQVDKISACMYDILFYTIEISNINNEIINNVTLKDMLPIGIKFINNTLFVDGVINRCESPIKGISLGCIEAKAIIIITFKAVISNDYYLKKIINSCNITFDYIDNIEKPPVQISIYSNDTITVCKDSLFKQFMVNNKINIPSSNGSIDFLIGVETEVEIISTKIVNYIVNPKIHNLIFIGILKYKICYMHRGRIHTVLCIQGFSTTLLVPNGVKYFKKINVKVYNEDTSYILINKSNLFIGNSLLIKIVA